MSTPSLAMIPCGYKAEKLYSVLPTDGSGDFTVSRASKKHKINSDLKLEIIENNVPALNYDTLGGCPVLNTEPQATNLITYPISFGTSYWTKSGAKIEGDASTAGANLISSTTVNTSYDTFDGASADGFHVIYSTAGTQRCGTADEIVFELGKIYKVEFNLSLASGDFPIVRARIAIGTSPVLFDSLTVSGSNVFYFVCDSAMTGVLEFSNSTASEYTISGLTTKEVQGFSAPSVDFPTSAFKLVESATTGGHNINKSITVTAGSNAISIRAKAGERNWILLRDTQSNTGRYFDLTNGVIGSVQGTTPLSSTIKPLADGWYDVSITLTAPATTTSAYVYVTNADATLSHTGDGTSGVYLFMAQLEQGSVATSPTFTDITLAAEGSTTTRLADAVSGAGDASTFNDSEGVLFAEIEGNEDGTYKFITISDGSTQNRVTIIFLSNNIVAQIRASNSEVFYRTTSGISIENYNKIAVHYKTNQCKLFVNGFQIGSTDTSAAMPSGLNTLEFKDGSGVSPFYGSTKQIQYFDTALTDAELISLTTL
jgi:hypothetical protein